MNKYPGRPINSLIKENVCETIINIQQLFKHVKLRNLEKPNIQGSLLEEKVDEMFNEYKQHPFLFMAKNKLIIIDLNNKLYLIDGQHRYEMLRKLYEENNDIKESISIVWYKFKKIEETICLFKSLNKDSMKNENYIKLDNYVHIKINDFMDEFKKIIDKNTFAKNKTGKGYIKTLEEFKDELHNNKFFNSDKTINELIDDIIKANDEFYKLNNYESNYESNMNIFYKQELDKIEKQVIYSLKNTNFIKWFFYKNTNPCHYYKKQKETIPQNKRTQSWKKYYGEELEGTCPISYCKEIIKTGAKGGTQIGHIISEKNGGKIEITNLRPICKKCNCEMGSLNWQDFDIESYNSCIRE